mmetsp:Transcript_3565/g.12138  ORF Transcript_3565/g.12138 Transcript_3565/m.12138 type:complete len:207 (+) Transcript_3565:1321-1941(+)
MISREKSTGCASRPSISVGSNPSSPYVSCTIPPVLFRTVPSYRKLRSSSAFISRRDMYPVSAVFTAVSTRPSRPAIVWKKNSVGRIPLKNEFATNPFAAGVFSPLLKCGSERSAKPSGGRCPPTACCPTHATICDMLIVDPFDPHSAMMSGALIRGSSSRHALPAVSRTLDRIPNTSLSSVCSALHPGCSASVPCFHASIRVSQSA